VRSRKTFPLARREAVLRALAGSWAAAVRDLRPKGAERCGSRARGAGSSLRPHRQPPARGPLCVPFPSIARCPRRRLPLPLLPSGCWAGSRTPAGGTSRPARTPELPVGSRLPGASRFVRGRANAGPWPRLWKRIVKRAGEAAACPPAWLQGDVSRVNVAAPAMSQAPGAPGAGPGLSWLPTGTPRSSERARSRGEHPTAPPQ